MALMVWAVVALLAGSIALVVRARRVVHSTPVQLAPGETLPATVLQTLARRTLALGSLPLLVALALLVWKGAARFYGDDRLRLLVTLLLLGALMVFAGFSMLASRWAARPAGPLDERDRAILEKAPALEGTPMLLTVVFWVIGLQQAYWDTGQVPLVYLYLIFWSLITMKALAVPVGVLAGYRRS